MSVTVSALWARIATNLREMDSRKPIDRIYGHQQLRDAYLSMQARLPAAYAYTSSAGTITAGEETFTLPSASGAEYAGDIRIQLQSNLQFLEKRTQDEIFALRNGRTSDYRARPTDFAPYEEDDQQVTCWCFPRSRDTETYNLFRSIVAADFSTTDIAGTTLMLGRIAQDALVLKTSARILLAMDDEDVKTRRLSRSVAGMWDKEGEVLIYQEISRRYDIESSGRSQLWRS